jgi:hypothetical protein
MTLDVKKSNSSNVKANVSIEKQDLSHNYGVSIFVLMLGFFSILRCLLFLYNFDAI